MGTEGLTSCPFTINLMGATAKTVPTVTAAIIIVTAVNNNHFLFISRASLANSICVLIKYLS